MARIFIEGWETLITDLWDGGGGWIGFTGGGVGGSYYYSGYSQTKTFASSYSELYFSLYISGPATGANTVLVTLKNAGSTIATLQQNSAVPPKLAIYRGTGTSNLLATGTTTVSTGKWNHIEFYYKPDPTSGVFQVKIGNEDLDIDFSGNTSAGTAIDGFNVSAAATDNIVVDTTGWIGDSRVAAVLFPNSDSSVNWTPSSGSNYACVDEHSGLPDLDDYVDTTANNTIDWYGCSNLIITEGVIKAVQVQADVIRLGAPTPTHLEVGVSSNGANSWSSDIDVEQAHYHQGVGIFENDPGNTDGWTIDSVNAMLIGIQSKA